MNALTQKIREVVYATLPIIIAVLLLHFTFTPLPIDTLLQFILGALFINIGMPLFLLGVELSIEVIGESISHTLIKTNNLKIVLIGSFLIGFTVSVAEPDLMILANQVDRVTNGAINGSLLMVIVSIGIGATIAFAIYRIIKRIPLNKFLTVIYSVIFILALFSSNDFLAIAFDASGSTTGSITVPFMLALAAGTSAFTRSSDHKESNSFGLLGIASSGAILSTLALGIIRPGEVAQDVTTDIALNEFGVIETFLREFPVTIKEAVIPLLPIIIVFFVLNYVRIHLPKERLREVIVGLIYTIVGLILFLTGVNAGFIEASNQVGYLLAQNANSFFVVVVGIIFGILTVPAEPSVQVLTQQIEEETAGAIKKNTVMIYLALGVGLSVGLSLLKIILPHLELWHILLPGMLIAIIMSYFVPDIFVGMAFDSGGVAAGTMTATFILPFAQGVAEYIPSANVLIDGFGVITLVALTPLITIQILGIIYAYQNK